MFTVDVVEINFIIIDRHIQRVWIFKYMNPSTSCVAIVDILLNTMRRNFSGTTTSVMMMLLLVSSCQAHMTQQEPIDVSVSWTSDIASWPKVHL